MVTAQSDEEIARAVQHGDIEAFGALVARYEEKLARYARKFLFSGDDAKDVVREVFIKAYVNIRGFDPRRRFSPWLYRIAHNSNFPDDRLVSLIVKTFEPENFVQHHP